jgi:hypothetical protein
LVFGLSESDVEFLAVFLCLIFLFIATVQDASRTEVEDYVWDLMIFSGIPLIVLRIFLSDAKKTTFLLITISIVTTFLIALVILLAGFWGPADSKALFSISFLLPLHPSVFIEDKTPFLPFPILALIYATLLQIFVPLGLFLINVMKKANFNDVKGTKSQKIALFFMGTPLSIDTFERRWKYFQCCEKKKNEEDEGGWQLELEFEIKELEEDFQEKKEQIKQFKEDKKRQVWVTPTLPFMLFLLPGFIFAIIFNTKIFELLLNIIKK